MKSASELEDVFRSGQTKMVVLFEPDFSESLEKNGKAKIQLIADATDPNTANTLVNYIQAILADYSFEESSGLFPFQIDVKARMIYNPELKGVYYFVPGIIVILLMLVSAMMTSISIGGVGVSSGCCAWVMDGVVIVGGR